MIGALLPGKPSRDQLIALAALFQACRLVETLAKNGAIPGDAFSTCIESLFEQNPDSVEGVYGGVSNLSLGVDTLNELLNMPNRGTPSDTLSYAVGILYLQGKVLKNKKMLQAIGDGIASAATQAETFSRTHENVLANLADLYQKTLGTFRFRIQVSGVGGYLQQPATATRVRCLLFAALRAAILWRQTGGRRWHLIWHRKALLEQLRQLQREL